MNVYPFVEAEQAGQRNVGKECALLEVSSRTFVTGTALALPFRSGALDTVLFLGVLEHLPGGTELSALREMKRVLAPGGQTPPAHTKLSSALPSHRSRLALRISPLLPRCRGAPGQRSRSPRGTGDGPRRLVHDGERPPHVPLQVGPRPAGARRAAQLAGSEDRQGVAGGRLSHRCGVSETHVGGSTTRTMPDLGAPRAADSSDSIRQRPDRV